MSKAWDEVRGVMVFRTLCDVAEGDELCFNYCDVLQSRDQRKKELLEDFGFDCLCGACQREENDAHHSDKRRLTIARLFQEVGTCGREPTLGIRKV